MKSKTKNKIAIQIITDAIIFERIIKPLNELSNIVNPIEDKQWNAADYYTGFSSAYALLGYDEGIKDETVTDEFHRIFFDHLSNDFDQMNSERQTPKELAQMIFNDWLNIIKMHDLLNTDLPFSLN